MRSPIIMLFLSLLILFPLRGKEFKIAWAKIQAPREAELRLEEGSVLNSEASIHITPMMRIESINIQGNKIRIRTSQSFRLDTHYYVEIENVGRWFLQPDGILDSLYSAKPLGLNVEGKRFVFRVFAPRAKWVRLVLFDDYHEADGREYRMQRDKDGVWEFSTVENLYEQFYGYRVWGPEGEGEFFDSTVVVADPYSPAVVTFNHYTHPAKTLILKPEPFDWMDDKGVAIAPRDLVIYEMHIRDMTAHPSSGVPEELRGTYRGLIYPEQRGGLPYIKDLGVNAVELLPAQDFANIEIPYRDSTTWIFNTWNPYERNHWGYMTSYFFAPESYYATGGTMERGQYNGYDGRQIREFKEMVRAFHQDSIAVLMDVVYNHVSQYDYNPLKYIDKFYYFRLTPDCEFESVSGCGNDLKTERPMTRRLIIESVLHWMKEYHIDGFRFDLANLLDRETCRQILKAARNLNPDVIIIAEPWGGGYAPDVFSDMGWASWNDQFRNGFKGWNPHNDRGFIFNEWQNNNTPSSIRRYITGSLKDWGGQYRLIEHSVNYLASHDDHTLGDFIRLALNKVDEQQRILDMESHMRLTSEELRTHKLAALALLTSQGMVMLHEGQEFARSKVIAKTTAPDSNWGKIDHNSYEKDNETNWLNYRYAEMNSNLREYYRGLIRLRKRFSAFRQASPSQFMFYDTGNDFFVVYQIRDRSGAFLVLLNGDKVNNEKFSLPEGEWQLLADVNTVYSPGAGKLLSGEISIPATSGAILRKMSSNREREQ
ncbi:MAG: pullulanase [Calditrichaeota bacterium]|nr:MAG: pullulanase [Calditrichota bacterium]